MSGSANVSCDLGLGTFLGDAPLNARPLPEPIRSTIMDGVENWRGYVIVICLGALAIVGVLHAGGVL